MMTLEQMGIGPKKKRRKAMSRYNAFAKKSKKAEQAISNSDINSVTGYRTMSQVPKIIKKAEKE